MELLAPAGSMESLYAAIENGADAVYMGAPKFNARQFASNITNLNEAVQIAHQNGVAVHLTLNTLIRDRELQEWLNVAHDAATSGVDAFIVQDLGGASLLRTYFPHIPLHASTQMTVHSTAGAKALEELSYQRIVLARELTKSELSHIKKNTEVELEVFVHGALCVSYSGQCLMSSMLGGRSANRGECAQPCRLQYTSPTKKGHLLSTKDLCLIDQLQELRRLGISSIKIEGRMKSAEYVGVVTRLYRRALDGKEITPKDREDLLIAFNRGGFTRGLFSNEKGRLYTKNPGNIGIVLGKPLQVVGTQSTIRTSYLLSKGDLLLPNAPHAKKTKIISAIAKEKGLWQIRTSAPLPKNQSINLVGRTPTKVHPNAAQYTKDPIVKKVQELPCPTVKLTKYKRKCTSVLAAQVQTKKQALAVLDYVSILYLPAQSGWEEIKRAALKKGVLAATVYPSIVADRMLSSLFANTEKGSGVLLGTLIKVSQQEKLADYSFNITNHQSLKVLAQQGYKRATFSLELNARQIEDIEVPQELQTEAIVYGHIPLMVTAHCPIECDKKKCIVKEGSAYLQDRKNMKFPLVFAGDPCRVTILNALPLFMGDKLSEVKTDVLRLLFTIEPPQECAQIASLYQTALQGKKVPLPRQFTRGHFYRGV